MPNEAANTYHKIHEANEARDPVFFYMIRPYYFLALCLSIGYTPHIGTRGQEANEDPKRIKGWKIMLKGWITTMAITGVTYQVTGSAVLAGIALLVIGIYFTLEAGKARSR